MSGKSKVKRKPSNIIQFPTDRINKEVQSQQGKVLAFEMRKYRTVIQYGDAMLGDGIKHLARLRCLVNYKDSDLKDGCLVCFFTPKNEIGIRRMHYDFKNKKVTLKSSNSDYETFTYNKDEIRVIGIIKGINKRAG